MKNLKISTIIIAMIFMVASTGCNKDLLDFSSDEYFGIEQTFDSQNCDADCGETADCEGKTVMIMGKLDPSNINADDNQFYLTDERDDDVKLEVKVDASIGTSVFEILTGNGGKTVKVQGLLEGYDASTNTNCKRHFLLSVSNVSDVKLN